MGEKPLCICVLFRTGKEMEIDKIEAFDYMLHLFEEWRDNHETNH